jgi:hypothetical protein
LPPNAVETLEVEADLQHAVPEDGYPHFAEGISLGCPCRPYVHGVPWMGPVICHRRMPEIPNRFPEEWLAEPRG